MECRRVRFALVALCAIFATGILSTSARAAMLLSMDINSLSAQWNPLVPATTFGTNATGTIVVSETSNTNFVGLTIDDVFHEILVSIDSISAEIEILNGMVVGGQLNVLLTDGSGYSALISDEGGKVNTLAGQGFMEDGFTFNGGFSGLTDSTLFGGVDVTGFLDQGLAGSFLHFRFKPDEQGFDTGNDLEVYVLPIPSPGAFVVFGIVGGLKFRRKRYA